MAYRVTAWTAEGTQYLKADGNVTTDREQAQPFDSHREAVVKSLALLNRPEVGSTAVEEA